MLESDSDSRCVPLDKDMFRINAQTESRLIIEENPHRKIQYPRQVFSATCKIISFVLHNQSDADYYTLGMQSNCIKSLSDFYPGK
ncbi:hypothetical protein TNCV_3039671 [Trichonephila clavipes]|uniref:Uncharacterized protein n=1 Tax=Trichonephila clavipes TaxID=2585209 RepID=A0A8X6S2S8_TRICX|nr:hypothetical protein TNCV_3039671 [Trichonephila clavipes]